MGFPEPGARARHEPTTSEEKKKVDWSVVLVSLARRTLENGRLCVLDSVPPVRRGVRGSSIVTTSSRVASSRGTSSTVTTLMFASGVSNREPVFGWRWHSSNARDTGVSNEQLWWSFSSECYSVGGWCEFVGVRLRCSVASSVECNNSGRELHRR